MAKILLIDDDAEFLQMLRLLFEQRGGHETILSADGKEGLQKAQDDPPDLAVIDVMMPDVNGYEVCQQLRAHSTTASVPIIILTARGQPVDRQAALDAGADEYMSKPVPMADLLERADALLAKSARSKQPQFTGTLALLSLRGGVGVTTLAVNLAATLAQSGSVCLVDLCSSSGHGALQLGLRPDPNWLGLVRAKSYDEQAVRAHLLQHESGLSLLAAPAFPVIRHRLPHLGTQAVFTALRRHFGTVVIDVPSTLDETTLAALEAAKIVGLVITPEPASIQTAIGTLRTLKQWSGKLRIILNQVAPGDHPSAAAIERALKRPLTGAIPFDQAQARALAQGAPLVLHNPNSPLAQGVQELIGELIHQPVTAER